MRLNQDYWHKTIIENTRLQIKNILLKWTYNFLTFSFISTSSDILNRSNINNCFSSDGMNSSIDNSTGLSLLQKSPFHSIYHIIKEFLINEILKVNLDSENVDKELNDIHYNNPDNLNKNIHPLFSLYNKMDFSTFDKYEDMNSLLAYFKIIDYVIYIIYNILIKKMNIIIKNYLIFFLIYIDI